jgi:hypothetical protein
VGGDASEQIRYVFQCAEVLNNTYKSDIELKNLDLKKLMAFSSEYMTYEGNAFFFFILMMLMLLLIR